MTVAIVTARGGSTRVPRKNLAVVCGKPLVEWSIINARCSNLVDEVYLTTDDDEIAEAGSRAGARIIRRPVWGSEITAGVAFKHAIKEVEKNEGMFDTLLSLLHTSPLFKPGDFDRLIRAHRETGATVGFACPQKETYIYRNVAPFQDRFLTLPEEGYYKAKQLTGDKFWNYSRLCGGASVCSTKQYKEYVAGNPDTDIEIDLRPIDEETVHIFVPVEEWQTAEIDYPMDLEIVRVFMENFICKGHGAAPYFEYKYHGTGGHSYE